MHKDYYSVMGLKRDASDKEIKTAYRRLARKYHPDLNKEPGVEEKFKELGAAYDILKDPEKRKIYDQYGSTDNFNPNAQAEQQAYSQAWANAGHAFHGAEGFDADLFESLFGRRGFHEAPRGGADLYGTIRINLEDAYKGVVKEIELPARGHPHQKLRIKIPAGVKSGQKIRLTGKGEPAPSTGGKAGDLYITVNVDRHPLFDVVENDIYMTLPVTPWEAALGSTVVVPTLGGKVDLKIPPNSQGGQTLRLKKRGFPASTQGDQYIILKIVIPHPTTDSAKALYQTMASEMPFNPRDKMESKHG
ncbi:MAG: DnaJ C-terminal domain-containing protein [Legionellaceae bacterium]|nr:DnaJ C-terminal domain-containing protein [Legionellaceae bacterium]